MKKILIIVFASFFFFDGMAQQLKDRADETSPQLTSYDRLILTAKRQKTAGKALIFSGIGVAALGGGLSLYGNQKSRQQGSGWEGFGEKVFGVIFLAAGASAIGTSIPFLVISKRNYQKALSMDPSLGFEKLSLVPGQTVMPALQLKLRF